MCPIERMSQMFLGRCREACDLFSFILFPLFLVNHFGHVSLRCSPFGEVLGRSTWHICIHRGASPGLQCRHGASKFSCSAVCISINFRFIQAQSSLEVTSPKTIANHKEKHKILPRKCSSCRVGYHWLTSKPCRSWVLVALLASS